VRTQEEARRKGRGFPLTECDWGTVLILLGFDHPVMLLLGSAVRTIDGKVTRETKIGSA
jgi:hypothetical protein